MIGLSRRLGNNLLFITTLFLGGFVTAQVGIGNSNPSNASLLDIRDDNATVANKGILIPRVDITDLDTQAPITGIIVESLLVYNTNATIGKGFYYWDNIDTEWKKLSSADDDNGNIYTTNGTLDEERIVTQEGFPLEFLSTVGENAMTLRRTNNADSLGIAFRNSGGFYDASIYLNSGTSGQLVFATQTNAENVSDVGLTMALDDNGNVGINTDAPDPSASIDMARNNQGLLVNRVSLTAANLAGPITSPADGLLVFNTNENLAPAGYMNDVRKGFYYWDATAVNTDATTGRWIPQKAENRSARFTNVNTAFNLNQATIQELPIFGTAEWIDDAVLYVFNDADNDENDLDVMEDGRYHIIVNIPVSTGTQRTNIDAEIEITRGGIDLFPGGTSSANYIRNQQGHDNSTIFINEIVELQAGDDISIIVSAETNQSGSVTIRSVGAANFTITKIK